MLFTVVIFAISAVCLLVAAVIYVPLLCTIQGNLKEYCCHKVDKRCVARRSLAWFHHCSAAEADPLYIPPAAVIPLPCDSAESIPPLRISELMKRRNRRRLAREADIARREARGDFSHLKDKTGRMVRAPRPQPTLPSVSDDLYLDPDLHDEDGVEDKQHAYPPPPPSMLVRDQSYGGVSDDHDSIAKGGYYPHRNDSVTSFDAYPPSFYGMERTPSYRTNPSSRDLVGPGGGEFYVDPQLAASYPGQLDSYHAPPARQGLYERSRAVNEEGRYYTESSEYDLGGAESTRYPSGHDGYGRHGSGGAGYR